MDQTSFPPTPATSVAMTEVDFRELVQRFARPIHPAQDAKRFNYRGLDADEKTTLYQLLTGKMVMLKGGMVAHVRDHWPMPTSENFVVEPECSNFDGDTTLNVRNAAGLGMYHSDCVPIALAWIDDLRVHMPHPNCKTTPLRDQSGQFVFGVNGEILRDIKCLPRFISTAVEGWRMSFWFTVDKRVRYADIIARMRFRCNDEGGDGPCAAGKFEFTQQLRRRVEQFREEHGILRPLQEPFDYDNYDVTQADIRAVRKHTRTQLEFGTWWTVDDNLDIMYQGTLDSDIDPMVYMLPGKLGISPRVQKILQFCQQRPAMLQNGIQQQQPAMSQNGTQQQQPAMSQNVIQQHQPAPQRPHQPQHLPSRMPSEAPPLQPSHSPSMSVAGRAPGSLSHPPLSWPPSFMPSQSQLLTQTWDWTQVHSMASSLTPSMPPSQPLSQMPSQPPPSWPCSSSATLSDSMTPGPSMTPSLSPPQSSSQTLVHRPSLSQTPSLSPPQAPKRTHNDMNLGPDIDMSFLDPALFDPVLFESPPQDGGNGAKRMRKG